MDIIAVLLLSLILASATALQQCDVPGECGDDEEGYFLMVVGGVNNRGFLDDVELASLDLVSWGPVPDCLSNLSSLPIQIAEGAGAIDYSGDGIGIPGMPFICGGFEIEACYKYDPLFDLWELSGVLGEERAFGGYGSSDSWGLVMAGGYSYTEGELSSVLTTGDGENFESLPDLPNPVYYNCLAVIDDDKIFTCGGREEQGFTTVSEAYMFSKLTSSWTSLAAMPTPRKDHMCGVVQGPEVVVAGGFDTGTSVDIYTVSTDSWRSGNGLPKAIFGAAVVPYPGTFFLVGGEQGSDPEYGYLTDIYRYDPENDGWVKDASELKTPRATHVAILVPQSIFPECA